MNPIDDQAPIAVWTDLEIGVGVICACLPAFRSLIGYIFPSLKMSLVADNSGNTPAYRNQTRSNNKMDKKGMGSSTRTFIELEDHHGSEDELHQNVTDGGSIMTQGSEVPISERLVPSAGKGYGNRVLVNVGGSGNQSQRAPAPDQGSTIMMTKTVEQSRE